MFRLIRKFITLLCLTISIPILIWGCGFVVFTASIYSMSEPKDTNTATAAIVLTGGTNRIEKGLDLLADKKITELLVSGVHKDVEVRDIMKLWGKTKNAPPCCITLGREAGNTIGNAQEAKKWIDHINVGAVYLITANYHMPRSLLEFKHVLPSTKLIPYPVRPENFLPREDIFWRTAFIEYHKLLVTILRIVIFPTEKQPLPEAFKK